MAEGSEKKNVPDSEDFNSVCHDCGTVSDAHLDGVSCSCGGIFHIDSARCLSCGGRHPFSTVGERCACGGEIVPKMVGCPYCGQRLTIEHYGEHCAECKIQYRMEG